MNSIRNTVGRASVCVLFAAAVLGIVSGCNKPDAHAGKNLITLTKNNFQTEVLSSSQPVLVDFWATWCGPCKMIAPTVAELAIEFEGKAKVGKVDVDKEPGLAKEYKVSAIPTLLIFKDGKLVSQMVGLKPKEELQAELNKYVATSSAPTAPAKP